MTELDETEGALHSVSGPDLFWSTTNVGEAIPGVVTPLGWSLWGPSVELGIRDCYARAGALPRRDVRVPDRVEDRLISVFFGRGALNVNFLCRMGRALPGSAPDAIARQLLGEVPPGIPLGRDRGRWPAVAVKFPYLQATVRRDVLRRAAPVGRWWREQVERLDHVDLDVAQSVLSDARAQFKEMTRVQAAGLFMAVQPVYDWLLTIIDRAGLAPEQVGALVSGHGSHVETRLVVDLWALARNRLSLREFLVRHGYHGPHEGEVSARVWREDPAPVRRLARQYAGMGDAEDPVRAAAERSAARREAERALVAALPPARRPVARLVLKAAVSRIPLRGVAKAAFLQALDVARGAARRIGLHLAAQGVLAEPDDVFYLTAEELLGPVPAASGRLVAQRRAQRESFQSMELPNHWRGMPAPAPKTANRVVPGSPVRGVGAAGGVVEGTVRVVHDPAFTDVEPGEVLVCATTDPSWASVLFLSSALVVDVGGPLSHAAVVAREIGVPCVVGTGDGTRTLRTGDRVRVDGAAGTVQVLAQAAPVDAVTRPEPDPAS